MPKILVVDDDEIICNVITESLYEAFNADVKCAQTGTQGAQLIAESPFDLAVIDAILPDVCGLDLALIAANENIAVLLTTGHPSKVKALEEFGVPYLAKPFGYEQLRTSASEILRNAAENITRVKEAAAKVASNMDALKATIEETRKVIAESKALTTPKSDGNIDVDLTELEMLVASEKRACDRRRRWQRDMGETVAPTSVAANDLSPPCQR